MYHGMIQIVTTTAPMFTGFSTAAKGYDCAFCDKSTKIGTLVVLYIYKLI